MKNLRNFFLALSILILSSCENDDPLPCPDTEIASATINGEVRQFQIYGRGIDYDFDGTGHTLSLNLASRSTEPKYRSFTIYLALPYRKTGSGIMERFGYSQTENLNRIEGDFVNGELQSRVLLNTNTCFRATFSGKLTIDGKEITITDGIIDHVYDEPFD